MDFNSKTLDVDEAFLEPAVTLLRDYCRQGREVKGLSDFTRPTAPAINAESGFPWFAFRELV